MVRLKSQLAKMQLIDPLSEEEIKSHARRAYHEKGLVLVKLDEIKDQFVKQEIINYADLKWGKK